MVYVIIYLMGFKNNNKFDKNVGQFVYINSI